MEREEFRSLEVDRSHYATKDMAPDFPLLLHKQRVETFGKIRITGLSAILEVHSGFHRL
jgi:hypothetical protein